MLPLLKRALMPDLLISGHLSHERIVSSCRNHLPLLTAYPAKVLVVDFTGSLANVEGSLDLGYTREQDEDLRATIEDHVPEAWLRTGPIKHLVTGDMGPRLQDIQDSPKPIGSCLLTPLSDHLHAGLQLRTCAGSGPSLL